MKDLIIKEIQAFVNTSPLNYSLDKRYKYFYEPQVGFASINDPLFLQYKEKIGEFYLLPTDWLDSEFGPNTSRKGTVISWVLPINEAVIATNRAETLLPSREWSHVRFYGEQFNRALEEHISKFLSKSGFQSIAPSISSRWQRVYSDNVGHASNWSERHAAYAAGLGTFSLNDALITKRGIAHRCGSVITELVIEPTIRQYQGIYDYCLHYNSQKCGACIKRCPVDAITKNGHNKDLCFSYSRTQIKPAVNEIYGVTAPGCGLCQTRVPCERHIPGK